jgi:hypothetical protein
MLQHITVDVHCHWSDIPPVYRIYVDQDMITERTFGWPGYQVYIKENIICNLNPGSHMVRVENCNDHGTITIENLHVEGYKGSDHPNYRDPSLQFIKFDVSP